MTNVHDLSGPANATYHTACAGIVPSDIIWSAATHQHLMHGERLVTGLSFEHCHQDIVSHQPLECLIRHVCHVCGEQGGT